MSSAVQAVFNTPELFQLILLQCDIRTLLTSAQRVSHSWHTVINSVPAIQESLFFRPRTRKEGAEPILNPLLVQTFGLFFDGAVHTRESFHQLPIAKGGEHGRRDALMREGASWRRMLVQQPPVRSMGVWRWETSWGLVLDAGAFWQLTLSDFGCQGPDGRDLNLTMGMLYDDGVSTATSRISNFTFFWDPKTRTNFAFAGVSEDQNVHISDQEGEENWDWDHPKLLSEVAKGVDLIKGMKYPGSCFIDGMMMSKEQIDFAQRFIYLSA